MGRDDQRIALASKPEFIVCDEPTSALDVSVRHMANRIGVMCLGRLVKVAPARELFAKPRHPYRRMLLDAVPDLDLTGRQRKPVEGEFPNPINPPSGCPFHPRCPFVFDRCRTERPLALPAGSATVACHAVEEGRI